MGKNKYSARQMIDAIQDANGIKAAAARKLGCSRNTVDKYIAEMSTVREAFEEANETNIDFVESSLMQAIKDGNVTAMIYFLKTKGRHRGWGENITLAGDRDAPLKIVLDR